MRNIFKSYEKEVNFDDQNNKFFFDTPGNIFKYMAIFESSGIDLFKDNFQSISHILDVCKDNKNPELLTFASFFIEIFYNDLSTKNNEKITSYNFNKSKIVQLINDIKKFNLDRKNLFIIFDSLIKIDAK